MTELTAIIFFVIAVTIGCATVKHTVWGSEIASSDLTMIRSIELSEFGGTWVSRVSLNGDTRFGFSGSYDVTGKRVTIPLNGEGEVIEFAPRSLVETSWVSPPRVVVAIPFVILKTKGKNYLFLPAPGVPDKGKALTFVYWGNK
jgi:hypothetical protein